MIVVAFCLVTIPLLTIALSAAYGLGRRDERARWEANTCRRERVLRYSTGGNQ